MSLNDIPIMSALVKRMKWLNQNQAVITQNIANADTPGYKPKKIEPQNFSAMVASVTGSKSPTGSPGAGRSGGSLADVQVTDVASLNQGAQSFAETNDTVRETSPTGNAVVLEEEMMKLADNQMQYGLITNLYKKNIGLLRAAMGKNSGGG